MSVETFTLPSYAKINWVLRILGRRTSGFHEIYTIFQTVSLKDHLRFTARSDDRLELTCDTPGIPLDESNLILRAALALRERHEVKKGASIHLEKQIPVEAGLGGGSSNAAIALLGLAHLWEVQTEIEELTEIGASLGADVPFFLTGGTAVGTGLGSEVRPVAEASAEHLLIVKPEAKVSTAEAYKSLRAPALTKDGSAIILSISRADERFADSYPKALHNDFEPAIFRKQPKIARVKRALLEAGAESALLAGSGSSVYGVFDKREALASALEILKRESGWRVFPCATVAREDYLKSLGGCGSPLLRRTLNDRRVNLGA